MAQEEFINSLNDAKWFDLTQGCSIFTLASRRVQTGVREVTVPCISPFHTFFTQLWLWLWFFTHIPTATTGYGNWREATYTTVNPRR